MKQMTQQEFNSSNKPENHSLKNVFSPMKNNNSNIKGNNKSVTCLNFPKLYSKLKYSRNKANSEDKSISDTNSNSSEINTNNNNNIDINLAIKIYHYPDSTKKEMPTNFFNILPNIFPQNISSKLHQYKYLNSFNKISGGFFSPMFLFKPKKTTYKKFLSENYRKNNEEIINKFRMEYKQRNDSILNAVKNKDGIFIKGMNYKKYYFFPHKKMNILVFHKKIMEENLKRFENRRKLQGMKKLENKNINNILDKRRSISNDNIFIPRAFNKRKSRKFFTKNFYTTKNLKNAVQNVVNSEVNKVTLDYKFYYD